MFNAIARWIRTLPWHIQFVAWLFFFPVRFFAQVVGFFFAEAFGQAKRGGKKVLAPLALPIIGICVLMIVGASAGSEAASALFQLFLTIVLMLYALKLMIYGFNKPKKKKP